MMCFLVAIVSCVLVVWKNYGTYSFGSCNLCIGGVEEL